MNFSSRSETSIRILQKKETCICIALLSQLRSLFFLFFFYASLSRDFPGDSIDSTREEAEEGEQVGAERVAKRIGEGKRGRGEAAEAEEGRGVIIGHWPSVSLHLE